MSDIHKNRLEVISSVRNTFNESSALEKRFHSSSSSITPTLLLKRIGESALLLKRIGSVAEDFSSVAEENPLLSSMEISLFAEQSSEQRFGNLDVYAVLCHARDTIGVRINVNSTIKELKDLVCKKWSTLMPTCFSFAFVRDNKRSTIDTDWDLQSLASCCESKGICSIEIYIDIGVSSSIDTSGASSSSVSVSFDGECEIRKPLRSDSWGSLITGVGQKFFGGAKEFGNNLRQFSILSGFKFKLRRNERKRVIPVCAFPDCKRSIHAVKKVSCPNVFIITKMSNKHSCKKSFDTFQKPAITSELIKSLIIDDVQRRPSIKPMDLMNKFSVEYGLNVKYYFARMGKELALKELYGDYSVSYNQFRWYTDSLKAVDPNGYVSLDVDPSTRKFRGLFIAYGASISGFTFCRPVIALDGTFLKDKHKGTLLCATALNGDQGLFPLAMAVVIGETEANWSWFLEQLKMIVSPHRPLVFMSDRHIGLLVHIPRVFPTSSHGFCFWHLKRNMNSSISSKSAIHKSRKSILELFKSTAIAYTIQDFNSRMEELQNLGGEPIRKFISEIAVEKWANAFFPAKRYGMLSSGIAESFNSWIRDKRVLPITCMIDKLRTKVMEMATNRREDARKWESRLCPEFEKKLIEKYEASRSMHVLKSTDFRFEVISTKNNVVDLQFFTCTCRQWQVECFPCAHAIAAIVTNGEEVYPYVESYFFVDSFIRSYSQGIPAISSLNMPMEIDGDSCILPPDAKVQPGRPKGKRMGTAATDKPKRKNSCSRCKCLGHNKSTCKVTL